MREPAPRGRLVYHDRVEAPPQRMTFDEYLAFTAANPGSFEYVGGFTYAKGVPSRAHALVAGNIFGHLWSAARATSCRAYVEKASLQIGPDTFLPDVFVACAPPGEDDWETAPCVVVEVLSPGTALVDRTVKRQAYTSLPSVEAYWIVSQDWRSVERHWRDAAGRWQLEHVDGDGAVVVPCPPRAPITLDEIYEGVAVPRVPPAPRRVREVEPVGR